MFVWMRLCLSLFFPYSHTLLGMSSVWFGPTSAHVWLIYCLNTPTFNAFDMKLRSHWGSRILTSYMAVSRQFWLFRAFWGRFGSGRGTGLNVLVLSPCKY